MNVRVHPVRFYGIYSSKEDVPHPRSDYDNHRDDGSPLVNGATQKMIDATVNLTEATAAENIHNFCSVGAEYIVLNRSILFAQYSEKSFYTYEPRRGAYFSFVELGEFESLFQSYGYELVQRTYTQRQKETSESTPVVVFNIEGYPLDCPFVTYYDHIFKKK